MTGVQTCALPIYSDVDLKRSGRDNKTHSRLDLQPVSFTSSYANPAPFPPLNHRTSNARTVDPASRDIIDGPYRFG